ncbi:MAG: ferrous iron transport protein A [Candidatus Omnitrophica bacterium]|nr:ferrous iron transport protein A [Candidatus Omnitrophota bacterium]
MKTKTDVTQLNEGQKAKVVEIHGGCGLIKKLDTLGIRPGVEIKKIGSQILKGPQILKIANTYVAIGFGMAKKIIVEKI